MKTRPDYEQQNRLAARLILADVAKYGAAMAWAGDVARRICMTLGRC